MSINHVARGNANTVNVVPVSAITAPAMAFEGPVAVMHTRDAPAGVLASPFAFSTVIVAKKTVLADVIEVGDVVNIDVPSQMQAAGGTAAGHCVEVSGATDAGVSLILNTQL